MAEDTTPGPRGPGIKGGILPEPVAGGAEGPAEGSERWPLDQRPQEQCGHLLRLQAEGECGQGGVRQQPEDHEPDLPYWSGHCTFLDKQRL